MNPEEETDKTCFNLDIISHSRGSPIGVSDLVFVDKFAIIAGDR